MKSSLLAQCVVLLDPSLASLPNGEKNEYPLTWTTGMYTCLWDGHFIIWGKKLDEQIAKNMVQNSMNVVVCFLIPGHPSQQWREQQRGHTEYSE